MSDNKDLSTSTEYSEGTTNEGGRGRGRGGRGRGSGGRGRGGRGRDGAPRAPRPPRPEVPGHRVSISHLPKDTSEADIKLLCQPYGKINDVFVRKYEAIVTFDKHADATYAIFDLPQKKYRDDHIIVEWAKPKKQFNDKEKKENENGEEEETKEGENKPSEGDAAKDQGKNQKKDPKEAEKKEEKPARPLFSEMQKVSTGSNPATKQPAKKKAAQPKKKQANNKQAEAPSQSDKQQETISVAAPEPTLKPVATLPPAENGTPSEQPASGKKAKQNKKQPQGTQQQSDNSQGKPARFEVKMRDINTRDVKSTLNSVSSEDIERFLKPLVPIFEVTVRNEATGEEKVYGLTDYHLKNNFTPFVQAYYSQLGDK